MRLGFELDLAADLAQHGCSVQVFQLGRACLKSSFEMDHGRVKVDVGGHIVLNEKSPSIVELECYCHLR